MANSAFENEFEGKAANRAVSLPTKTRAERAAAGGDKNRNEGLIFTTISDLKLNADKLENSLLPPLPPLTPPKETPVKSANKYLRWNLLLVLLLWLFIPFPLWIPLAWPAGAAYAILATKGFFTGFWILIISLAYKNMIILFRNRNTNFRSLCDPEGDVNDIQFAFGMVGYKEPLTVICSSLDSIKDQTERGRITCAVFLEEKTPDLQRKSWYLTAKYGDCGFRNFLVIIHPSGREDEIPGKCSNANHGVRQLKNFLSVKMGAKFDPEKILVTTCDADVRFHPSYCASLVYKYLNTRVSDRNNTIYQAPHFYNWGLDAANTVTRTTGLFRSTFMLGGLIPLSINPMSNFSYSLQLCIQGNYIHPRYQMEDIICLVRWMGVTQRRIQICMLPLTVISGPTSGRTVEDEWVEWARQARRWTIGAGEVFHYYVIKAPGMPLGAAFSWGLCFVLYYGVMLCTDGLFNISTIFSLAFLVPAMPFWTTCTFQVMALLQALCFVSIFLLDAMATSLMQVEETISIIRNLFHFIMCPFVLLGYSVVEFFALHELAVKGKEVCKHGAAKKSALESNDSKN